MDSVAHHPAHDARVHDNDRGYGAIVAAVIAVVFLGFVVHAATLAPQAEAGKAPAAGATPKAAH